MPVVRVSGSDDPRVSWYQAVRDPVLVRERGLFVAEGRLVVERLIREGRYTIQSLLLSAAACRALEPVLSTLPPEVPIYVCDAGDLRGITGYDVHRGCLALAERPAPLSIDAVLRGARLVVVLDGVTDPDNVGGVFRNAAAFGVDAVLLDAASSDPLYRKAIRTSMAATLRCPVRPPHGPIDGMAVRARRSCGPRLHHRGVDAGRVGLRSRRVRGIPAASAARVDSRRRGPGRERRLRSRCRPPRPHPHQPRCGLPESRGRRGHRAASALSRQVRGRRYTRGSCPRFPSNTHRSARSVSATSSTTDSTTGRSGSSSSSSRPVR